MVAVEVHNLPQFNILYNLPPDTSIVVLIGGRTRGRQNIRGVKVCGNVGYNPAKTLRCLTGRKRVNQGIYP